METILVNLKQKARKDTLEGRPHLVANAVFLKDDAILQGNKGKVLYPKSETSKNVSIWNHLPITIGHPKTGDTFTSARTKRELDKRKVGIVLNTSHVDGKLRPEVWFDEERTKELDVRVYNALNEGTPMEMSIGLNADVIWEPGTLQDGSEYKGVATNFQPDHLAILPDETGAYSVAMGGGLFANSLGKEPDAVQTYLGRCVEHALKTVGVVIANGEMSFGDVTRSLSEKLASTFGEKGQYWKGYICEVYPDYVVFCDTYGSDGKMFKVGYSAADGEVTLTGKAVEVTREVSYVANEAAKEETPPLEKEKMFDKKAHITALITNGQLEESQRAAFEALPDDAIKAMKIVEKVTVTNATPVQIPAPTTTIVNQTPNFNDFLNSAPREFREVIAQGQAALTAQRVGYIEKIKANPKNTFSDAFLANSDVAVLAGMANLAEAAMLANGQDDRFINGQPPTLYTGQQGGGGLLANRSGPALEEAPEVDDPKWGDA